MGITSITEQASHYGLSLALGGAEVTPLELAQAYGVFSNEGIVVPYTWNKESGRPVIRKRVLETSVVQDISDILSDDVARSPTFGRHSALNFPDGSVAVKTGTTNNSRDIWVVGYSPDLVVLVWAGNSDGAVLENGASGFSLAPLFRDIMKIAVAKHGTPHSSFTPNTDIKSPTVPDVVQGIIDRDEPHSILHSVDKDNPAVKTEDPENNPQYESWEFGVTHWLEEGDISKHDNARVNTRRFSIEEPRQRATIPLSGTVSIAVRSVDLEDAAYEFYVNNRLIGSSPDPSFSFEPLHVVKPQDRHITIQVIATTSDGVYLAERRYNIDRTGRRR